MVNAAQCHGKARERKGSARKEKGRAAEKERKKKMGMERMREFTLWRIFEITNYSRCFWEISASCNPVKRAKLDILRNAKN